LAKGNPDLRRDYGYERIVIGSRSGLHTVLSNRSEATRRPERIELFATQLRDGSLFYLIGVAPTDEEGVKLLGTMVAYAGKFTLDGEKVVHHIDVSWNQAWTGTDQVRYYDLSGDMLTITTAAYRSYQDGRQGRSVLIWKKVDASPVWSKGEKGGSQADRC